MKQLFKLASYLFAILFVSNVYAVEVEVIGAWGHATAAGQDSASLDLHIRSEHGASLVGVSSSLAKSAEIHTMYEEAGVMKMREVKSLDLPAGKITDLSSMHHHLMLIGLSAPLKTGDKVPLVLTCKLPSGELVKVEAHATIKAQHHQHHHIPK